MKEVFVYDGLETKVIDSSVPRPGPHQIVIKVEVSGSNPKDMMIEWAKYVRLPLNNGDDVAGTVHEVGEGVLDFKPGDRVFAFHEMLTSHGSWAEYAVAPDYTTAILPSNITFEEAATIPLAAMTSAQALFRSLSLPTPWAPASTSTPLLIYGGSSAVGAFAIKLALLANIHPIIAVAGAGCGYVSSLLESSKGDVVFDYRNGSQKLAENIQSHLSNTAPGTTTLRHALAAITNTETIRFCCSLLGPGGNVAYVLPLSEDVQTPDGITTSLVMVGDVHDQFGEKAGYKDLGYVMNKLFTRWLQAGTFKGHPYEVTPGGLDAVPVILNKLKEGKASAVKYVFRIADTPNLET